MNNIKSKLLLISIGIALAFPTAWGQSANTEFFMSSSFTKSALNPAKRPEKGYIGIPGLTNLSVNYRTNTFTLDNFLYPGLGENGKSAWFLNKNVSASQFLKGISDNNLLHTNVDYTLLGFGFYVKDLFLSFDVSVRTSADVNIPGDIFRFAKKGVSLGTDEAGKEYNFSNTKGDLLGYTQVGFGGSYSILNQSLVIGSKIKLLFGAMHGSFNTDQLLLNVDRNEWTLHSLASMQITGPGVKYDEDGVIEDVDFDNFSAINGFGLGLDLGATFKPGKYFDFSEEYAFMDNFTFSAALTDVGFINWDKSKTTFLHTDETAIDVTGNHNIGFEDNSDNSLGKIIEDLGDRFTDAVKLKEDKTGTQKSSSGIRAKLNWGVEYALCEGKVNTGLLLTSYFNPVKTNTELTLAGAYRPASGFEVGLSYSFIPSYYGAFELALHFGPGFYIASSLGSYSVNSDGMPAKMNHLNVMVGAAIPIGAKH
ncbi:hypothetical protein AGMMS50262_17560 [Bacteroidia bacterium]|nr:hypothetical protein AGMMS50262_17560 [Bacteroidia bacterium]